jgi:hypothetical protein
MKWLCPESWLFNWTASTGQRSEKRDRHEPGNRSPIQRYYRKRRGIPAGIVKPHKISFIILETMILCDQMMRLFRQIPDYGEISDRAIRTESVHFGNDESLSISQNHR